MLSNLSQIFGTNNFNAGLDFRAEQGTHYEGGYKANIGKGNLRFALFNFKIKDSIDADVNYDKDGVIEGVDYFNEDVKNTGVELSYAMKHDDNWTTRLVSYYLIPKAQNLINYGDMYWHLNFYFIQVQGAVDYTQSKFAASMSVNFVGDRMSTRASIKKPQREIKPQCFTDLHFTYAPEKNQKAFLHINNIFDRLDITSNSTSNFYSLGRNFMVGYEYSF